MELEIIKRKKDVRKIERKKHKNRRKKERKKEKKRKCCIVVRKRYIVKIKLIVYSLKWYSPTSIISLALLVSRPKLVFLLTDVLSEVALCCSFCFCSLRDTTSFILPWYRKSRGTSHNTTERKKERNIILGEKRKDEEKIGEIKEWWRNKIKTNKKKRSFFQEAIV